MAELAATYHLSPTDFWALTQTELAAFQTHHDRLVKESRRG
jgi:hypothetical protein